MTGPEVWIPLEILDDRTLDLFPPEEVLARWKKAQGNEEFAVAKGLHKTEDNFYSWKPILVKEYNHKLDKYLCLWAQDNTEVHLPRILVCFDVFLKVFV